jgi:hypothetical protein
MGIFTIEQLTKLDKSIPFAFDDQNLEAQAFKIA